MERKEYLQKYREENKERLREYHKKYYENRPERLEQSKNYYWENREKVIKRQVVYHKLNENYKEYQRKYWHIRKGRKLMNNKPPENYIPSFTISFD